MHTSPVRGWQLQGLGWDSQGGLEKPQTFKECEELQRYLLRYLLSGAGQVCIGRGRRGLTSSSLTYSHSHVRSRISRGHVLHCIGRREYYTIVRSMRTNHLEGLKLMLLVCWRLPLSQVGPGEGRA